MSEITRMKLKFPALVLALLVLPSTAPAWSGNTWANITRTTIRANADQMIDFTWTPKNTFTNFQYGSTYRTYYKGKTYPGVAYSQTYAVAGMVQQNFAEFTNSVATTSGGTVGYGNDCSGFVSICWRLPARKTTATFESQLGTYWTSLGEIGTAATAPLVMGDALNSSSVGHIVLFLNLESTGVRTMEQTPNNTQRKLRTFSNVAEYRPIRRLNIVDAPTLSAAGVSRVVDKGNATTFRVSASGSGTLAYRWHFNGSAIAGATTSQLNFSAAQLTHAGNYWCVVTNAYGATTSRVMSLTVYPHQTTVFLDAFDTNSAARWQLNRSSTDTRVTFNYDYSAMGIPAAPRSTGGTTRGLKMEANMTAGVTAAVSLSPLGQVFAGDYRLRFDAWINANGPFPAGGTGSTQHETCGLGTAGNRLQWTGSGATADGYWFSFDGEGQASDASSTGGDYCAFIGTTLQGAASGVYAAGTNSTAKGNLDAYYVNAFPGGAAAPAAQQGAYPQQTGGLADGTVGFAWREVIVSRRGNTVDWSIDGIRLATISNATFTASNVFIGYWDCFTSLSDNTNLSFGVVDNVRVEVPTQPPVITTPPQGQTIPWSSNCTFTVTATGTAPLAYQWKCNGTNLVGATGSSYVRPCVQKSDEGSYMVTVTNAVGAITSSPALLNVTLPQPVQFQQIAPQADARIRLRSTGEPGWSYTLQIATNLDFAHPITIPLVCGPDGTFEFVDDVATNAPQRFYRLKP